MNKLVVTASPYINSSITTQKVMLNVLIALSPAIIASVIIFGLRALIVTVLCSVSCVVFEYLCRKIMKKSNTVPDLSAVVTGVILAMNLPVTIPYWMAVIGSFIAIVITKQLFGGIGENFANPAIVARIVLMLSFTAEMSNWVVPFYYKNADIVTSATPLADGLEKVPSYLDLFLGTTGGCLGETCALALLIGGIYMIVTKTITATTPVVYIGTVFVLNLITGHDALYQILSGGLFIGAFFMATDYSTSPVTNKGKIIFAFGCGVITFLIRTYGSYPEGVSFAILLMNILTPYIEMISKTKPFGAKAKEVIK